MLKENLITGMKVITVGDPENGRERTESETCRAEKRNGYSLVKEIGAETVLIGSKDKGWHARFKHDKVHPLWGDTQNG